MTSVPSGTIQRIASDDSSVAGSVTSIAFVGLWNPTYFVEWAEKIVHHTLDPSSINIGYATIADADFFHGIPRYVHLQGLLRDDPEARHERTLALAAVTVTVLEENKVKFTGSVMAKMSDFKIEPVNISILGIGLIKTGDEVKLLFEWVATKKATPAAK